MSADHYEGLVYRALNPVYARTPLSGEGAARYGGRFNRKGQAALYASLHPDTAIREANQVGTLQPTTLVALRADIQPIFDTRARERLHEYGADDALLADPAWRKKMLSGETVPTQRLAETLIADGYAGMFVRSFALGAPLDAVNLVLWSWNTNKTTKLELVDDDGRLGVS